MGTRETLLEIHQCKNTNIAEKTAQSESPCCCGATSGGCWPTEPFQKENKQDDLANIKDISAKHF